MENSIDEEKKAGYIAGIMSILIAAMFFIVTINIQWGMSAQVLGVFSLVFGLLGVGSLWKPTLIGPITAQILENIRENSEGQNKRSYKQTQSKSKNSQQVYSEQGAVHITNIYEKKSKKKRTS